MKKITSIIMYVLLAISLLSVVPTFLYGADGLDYALYWMYILLGLSILTAIVMSVISMGKNPGGGKTALIGFAAVAIVLVISYFLSSTDPVLISGGKDTYENTFGLVVTDMGLYTTYVTLIAAIVIVVAGEVRNSLK